MLPWYVLGAALPILMVVAGLHLRGMARGVRVAGQGACADSAFGVSA
jgi:hypothetical protein